MCGFCNHCQRQPRVNVRSSDCDCIPEPSLAVCTASSSSNSPAETSTTSASSSDIGDASGGSSESCWLRPRRLLVPAALESEVMRCRFVPCARLLICRFDEDVGANAFSCSAHLLRTASSAGFSRLWYEAWWPQPSHSKDVAACTYQYASHTYDVL